MTLSQVVADKLLQINAIKLSPQKPFTWASGWLSPIYCDNRLTLSYPEIRNIIKSGLAEKSKAFGKIDSVVGVATAGIAHGALLADELDLPFAYVRPKPKEHGRQNKIEGRIEPGSRVLVVEDLISTGGSIIKAVNALREENVEVAGALAIFTYEFQHSVENMKNEKIFFDTLSDYSSLLERAVKLSYIHETDLIALRDWRKAPDTWKPI
jgi:orotate phosphoribosyltransferase